VWHAIGLQHEIRLAETARISVNEPFYDTDVTFSAVSGRGCALGRSHLVALPTAPYDGTVTGRIHPSPLQV
jgi:hypothetical protein